MPKTAVTPRPPTGKTGTSNRARRDPTTHKLGQNAYVTAWRPVARAASGIRRAPQRRASAANARRADLTHAPPRFNAPDAARADRPRAADTPALSLRRGRPPPPPPRAGPSHEKISFARAGRRCRHTAPRRGLPCAGRVDRPASTTLRALGRPPRPPDAAVLAAPPVAARGGGATAAAGGRAPWPRRAYGRPTTFPGRGGRASLRLRRGGEAPGAPHTRRRAAEAPGHAATAHRAAPAETLREVRFRAVAARAAYSPGAAVFARGGVIRGVGEVAFRGRKI